MDRVKNSIIHSSKKDYKVFIPSHEDLSEIIPEGNKVKIRRLDIYEWAFGTKKFEFVRDEDGEVYAKTRNGVINFDDFISINQLSEMKKSINTNIQNVYFSDDSQDLAEADYAFVGNEFDGVDENDSSLRDKIVNFSM
jgi:hypothetical protein